MEPSTLIHLVGSEVDKVVFQEAGEDLGHVVGRGDSEAHLDLVQRDPADVETGTSMVTSKRAKRHVPPVSSQTWNRA